MGEKIVLKDALRFAYTVKIALLRKYDYDDIEWSETQLETGKFIDYGTIYKYVSNQDNQIAGNQLTITTSFKYFSPIYENLDEDEVDFLRKKNPKIVHDLENISYSAKTASKSFFNTNRKIKEVALQEQEIVMNIIGTL